jgi:hypothetical protein
MYYDGINYEQLLPEWVVITGFELKELKKSFQTFLRSERVKFEWSNSRDEFIEKFDLTSREIEIIDEITEKEYISGSFDIDDLDEFFTRYKQFLTAQYFDENQVCTDLNDNPRVIEISEVGMTSDSIVLTNLVETVPNDKGDGYVYKHITCDNVLHLHKLGYLNPSIVKYEIACEVFWVAVDRPDGY